MRWRWSTRRVWRAGREGEGGEGEGGGGEGGGQSEALEGEGKEGEGGCHPDARGPGQNLRRGVERTQNNYNVIEPSARERADPNVY